jgi:hypothetical protein
MWEFRWVNRISPQVMIECKFNLAHEDDLMKSVDNFPLRIKKSLRKEWFFSLLISSTLEEAEAIK